MPARNKPSFSPASSLLRLPSVDMYVALRDQLPQHHYTKLGHAQGYHPDGRTYPLTDQQHHQLHPNIMHRWTVPSCPLKETLVLICTQCLHLLSHRTTISQLQRSFCSNHACRQQNNPTETCCTAERVQDRCVNYLIT
jgi:hypothetical protein